MFEGVASKARTWRSKGTSTVVSCLTVATTSWKEHVCYQSTKSPLLVRVFQVFISIHGFSVSSSSRFRARPLKCGRNYSLALLILL